MSIDNEQHGSDGANGGGGRILPPIPFDGQRVLYAGWALKVRALLHEQDLFDVVMKPVPHRRGNKASSASVIAGADDADDEVQAADSDEEDADANDDDDGL